MQETWIAIVMLASQLTGYSLLGEEFKTQEECWKHYLNHPHMRRVVNDIPTTRPTMLFEIQTMGLGWITCVRRYKLDGNIITKPLVIIQLPTPTKK